MSLETAITIADLVAANPPQSDSRKQGAGHLRLIKQVLQAQFPGAGGAGFAIPITANEVEINYLSGVTSAIQAQITSALYTANTGITNAGTAQTTANTAVSNAATAQAGVNAINTNVPINVQQGAFNTATDTGIVNASVLTLSPAPTLAQNMEIAFTPAYANTVTNPTVTVNGTALPLTGPAGAALIVGQVPVAPISIMYSTTGGAHLELQGIPPPVWSLQQTGVSGSVSGFTSSAVGINNYNCTVAGREVVLENGSNMYMTIRNFSKTINANGIVGAPLSIMSASAASTWYYRWLWYSAANGLTATLDISSTAPTAPTGYVSTDYKCLLPGAALTDSSSSKYLKQIRTAGLYSSHIPLASSNTAAAPIMVYGVSAGSDISTPTWAAVGISNFVPPTAIKITVSLSNTPGAGICIAAPNASYGPYGSTTNAPPLSGNYGGTSPVASFLIESTNIYYASNNAVSLIMCLGWEG